MNTEGDRTMLMLNEDNSNNQEDVNIRETVQC